MGRVNNRFAHSAIASAVLLATGALQQANAQEAAPAAREEGKLEEMVVTGTKRDVSQQEAPLAVTAITGESLEAKFSTDLRTIGTMAPNVVLTNQTGFNAIAGGIRGTGSISILTTQDASVGISIDDFALNHVQAQFVELFDIDQIEVYRGPQGTLFGKNSTGGAIVITSRRPDMNEFGANISVGLGDIDGNEQRKFKAAFDVPLIPGELSFRFAGTYDSSEGFYRNSKPASDFPNRIPLFAAFGLPSVNPPLPPELNTNNVGNHESLNDKNVFAGKAKLLWQPNDVYEAYAIYEIVRDRSDSPPGVNESPAGENFLLPNLGFAGIQAAGNGDPFRTGVSQQGNGINLRAGHQVDVDGFYLKQSLELGSFTLTSITGYRYQEETLPSTYTGEAFISLFDASRNLERDQIQQEFRLISNFDGPFNFVAGAGYFEDNLEFRAVSTVGLQSLLPQIHPTTGTFFDPRGFINLNLDFINDPGTGNVSQDRTSYAVYADGTYEVTDALSLTAGLRYTSDQKDFEKHQNGGGACNQFTKPQDARLINPALPFSLANCRSDNRSSALSRFGIRGGQFDPRDNLGPNSQYGLNVEDDNDWTDVTWRLAVNYKLNDEQLVYGTISTGYLSGGFSETCSSIVTCQPFDQETNTNFEVGFKGDFLDNTLRTNVAVFYTMFEDLQRNQVVPFTNASGNADQETVTVNAGESHSQGIEIETTWLPIDELEVTLNVGYLKAEYDDFEFDPTPNNTNTGVVDFSGLDIPFSPEWNASFGVTYNYPLFGGNLALNLNGHYQDEAETSPFDPNAAARSVAANAALGLAQVRHPTNSQIEERFLLNASAQFTSADDRYRLAIYGKNLTDQTYRATSNSVAALWNFTQYGAPLEFGFEFSMNLQ